MNFNFVLAKSVRNCPTFSSSSITRGIFSGKFRQATTIAKAPERDMDVKQTEKPGGVMSQSFGDGYSTRSDEEGFGGISSCKQSLNNVKADKEIHANHPAYDKTQGSEVKEKEQAQHQTNASS